MGSAQDFLMKKFAALLLPMMSKQASKFVPTGKLAHLHESGAARYAELDRRLASMGSAPAPASEPPAPPVKS